MTYMHAVVISFISKSHSIQECYILCTEHTHVRVLHNMVIVSDDEEIRKDQQHVVIKLCVHIDTAKEVALDSEWI